jgi:FtsZ-interacting cell division protein ZipA
MKQVLLAILAMVLAVAGNAQQKSIDNEALLNEARARLEVRRKQQEAYFVAESAACYQRFAVTDCLGKVKSSHYAAMSVLRREEIALNDLERQQKASEALARLADKNTPEALQEKEKKIEQARKDWEDRQQRADQKAIDRGLAPAREQDALRETRDKETQRQDEAAARERMMNEAAAKQKGFDSKVQEAQEHKAERLQKNAEEPSTAKPLPSGR